MTEQTAIQEATSSQKRKEAENLIYKVMKVLDPTGANAQWYMEKFSKMNDKQFYAYFSQEFPIKFQMKMFEIEPSMPDIQKAADLLKVPLMERIYMPFLYEDNNAKPVKSNFEALVVYVPIKKTKQFISKKNSMSTNTDERNAKTGRLIAKDKNGNTSDREFESLVVMDLPNTIREFSTYRADAMRAKDEFYATIAEKNMVSLNDVEVSKTDSVARNTLNTYLIGAGILSNLVTVGTGDSYVLPHTVANNNRITREVDKT